MSASSCPKLALPKGLPRRCVKAAKDEVETRVIRRVHAEVWHRAHGQCEFCGDTDWDTRERLQRLKSAMPARHHMHERYKRSATRGLPPEERFNTANCCRACPLCHSDITENRKREMFADARKGFDGEFWLEPMRPKRMGMQQ